MGNPWPVFLERLFTLVIGSDQVFPLPGSPAWPATTYGPPTLIFCAAKIGWATICKQPATVRGLSEDASCPFQATIPNQAPLIT
jgi:hypothetical protein